MHTLTLRRSWIGDSDYRIEVAVTEDFNGGDCLTLFYTGVPIAHATCDDRYGWDWNDLTSGNDDQLQVKANFLFMLGEVSEDDYQRFTASSMGPANFEELLEHVGDGHEWTSFIEEIEQAYAWHVGRDLNG